MSSLLKQHVCTFESTCSIPTRTFSKEAVLVVNTKIENSSIDLATFTTGNSGEVSVANVFTVMINTLESLWERCGQVPKAHTQLLTPSQFA